MDTLGLSIHFETYEEDSQRLLKIIRPQWSEDKIKFKVFSGGITNTLLLACEESDTEKNDGINIRIHGEGTDVVIDRPSEMIALRALELAGCGAKLYAKFNNGTAYQYLKGHIMDEKIVRDTHIGRLIAKQILKMHQVDGEFLKKHNIKLDTKPIAFERIHKWVTLIPDDYENPQMNSRFKKELPSVQGLKDELELIEKHVSILNAPVVFGHNDLLLGNILYDKQADAINFIDYEYASFTYEAFDIGNHFCEWAGVDTVDYTLYPDKETQLVWLRAYLEEKEKVTGTAVTDASVEKLYVQVNKYSLAANLHWGIWALLQARHSKIDFDFMGYSIIRINEYFAKKDQFLALKIEE